MSVSSQSPGAGLAHYLISTGNYTDLIVERNIHCCKVKKDVSVQKRSSIRKENERLTSVGQKH